MMPCFYGPRRTFSLNNKKCSKYSTNKNSNVQLSGPGNSGNSFLVVRCHSPQAAACRVRRRRCYWRCYCVQARWQIIINYYARQHICYMYSAYMPRQFRLSVRLSVRPSHACIVSKRLNVSSKFFHCLIGPSFQFFVTEGRRVNLTASSPTGAPNTRGQQKLAIFDQYAAISRKGYQIVTMEDEQEVICALSNSATFDYLE